MKNVTQFLEDRAEIRRTQKGQGGGNDDNMSLYSEGKVGKKNDMWDAASDYSSDFGQLPEDSSQSDKDDGGEQELFSADIDAIRVANKVKQGKSKAYTKAEHGTYSSDSEGENVVTAASKAASNPEVNDMHLIWEDEMQMMIASNAKEFLVFDEEDPEKSTLLRRVIRAHQEEVTISAYSYHLSLVATGCINGEIALYDFETSKVEGLLLGHTGDITAIEFMDPYPALISASMDYTIAIWGVRPCPAKLQNVCLKRLTNLSWRADADVKSVATRILLWQGVQTGITKHRRLKDKQLPVEARRRFENNIVFSRLDLHKTFKQ